MPSRFADGRVHEVPDARLACGVDQRIPVTALRVRAGGVRDLDGEDGLRVLGSSQRFAIVEVAADDLGAARGKVARRICIWIAREDAHRAACA